MPVLVKGDNVRSGTKANAHHGWLRPAQEPMGLLQTVFLYAMFWKSKFQLLREPIRILFFIMNQFDM